MNKLAALYVNTEANIGDAACTPIHYFPDFFDNFDIKRIVIGNTAKVNILAEDTPIVVGGGGLLASKAGWDESMIAAVERSRKAVAWGLGLNRSVRVGTKFPRQVPEFHTRFALFGIRDWIEGLRWVPCVSAMSDAFDAEVPIEREYGIFLHCRRGDQVPANVHALSTPENTRDNFGGFDQFDNIVRFLKSSDAIITNSYHGVYWGTILGKRVVRFDTFSEKFQLARWHVPVINAESDIPDVLRDAPVFDEAMSQARRANRSFYEDVRELFA